MENINLLLFFCVFNLFIYFLYEKISKIINVYDVPNIRKIHKKKTPLIGGYIIFFNLTLFSSFVFFDFYDFNYADGLFTNKYEYFIFYLASLILFFIGALDDKIDIRPNIKLFLTTLLLIFILNMDNTIIINHLRFSFIETVVSTGKYAKILTILCFLLFINACNMFDGINLQSSSYISILFFCIINLSYLNFFLIYILVAFVPIIFLNGRGKIFMGDSGIYLCSFIISYVLIKNYNINTSITTDYIFILMMLPGIDMFRLFIQRMYNKRNPFSADTNHIHHLLLRKFNQRYTIIILNLFIIIPIYLSILNFSNVLIILFNFFLYFVFIFFLTKKSFLNI